MIDSKIFLPEAPKDQKRIDQARTDALYNPLIVGNFLSTDGNVTALMVSVREDTLDDTFDRRASQAIDGVLAWSASPAGTAKAAAIAPIFFRKLRRFIRFI